MWFAACVGDLAAAVLIAGLARLCVRRWCNRQWPATPLVWGGAFVLGLVGPGIVSALVDRLIFTWPLALYAAFHGTMLICWWSEPGPARQRKSWPGRLACAGLVLVAYGYFELCRAAGMYISWAFLAGFPVAFPLTLLAAHAEMHGQRAWVVVALTLPAFALFFGSGPALLWWKSV